MEKRDKKGLTEQEAIALYRTKNYPKPALTADVIAFETDDNSAVRVLLVKRGGHPFIGCWALPGGFAEENEFIETTASRELMEETGVNCNRLIPVGLFTRPGRDPRGWVVSQAFAAVYKRSDGVRPHAGDDADQAKWFSLTSDENTVTLRFEETAIIISRKGEALSKERLAFDHAEILLAAMRTAGIA